MKRILILLMLVLLVAPVVGIKENFQDWSLDSALTTSPDSNGVVPSVYIYNTAGYVGLVMSPGGSCSGGSSIINTVPSLTTYSAIDVEGGNLVGATVYLYDSATPANVMASYDITSGTRLELKMVGGSPTTYHDGILVATGGVLSQNPSQIRWRVRGCGMPVFDNVVYGETDHHLTGSLPTNWTIQRDFINPAATGVYAWNPNTGVWVLKNSQYFYVEADKEGLTAETLSIRHIGGTVINATSLSPVHNFVQYNLTQFLTTSTSVGSIVPDGQYSVSWDTMSPPNWYADTFWITSSGATVNWDKAQYQTSDTASIAYVISGGYYDTSATGYTYTMEITDVYGVVKQTTVLGAISGAVSVPLNEATYPVGVYYAQVKATKKSDLSVYIMAYDGMEMQAYVVFNGYVMSAENGTVLSGATINMTQGTSTLISTSGSGGVWNSSNNWLSGSAINITTNKTGYTTDILSVLPLSGRSIFLNISLLQTNPTYSGVSIGGVVRDNVYGNPVTSATYWVQNGTAYSSTTNIAGFARVDNLPEATWYNVWSSKTGFGNSSVVPVLAVSS
jgi:hypothetical protein